MVKNIFIGLNLSYLAKFEKLSKDDFGALFGLGKNVLSGYIRNNKCNNIEFLLKLSHKYDILLNDLYEKNLTGEYIMISDLYVVNESEEKDVYTKLESANKEIEELKFKIILQEKTIAVSESSQKLIKKAIEILAKQLESRAEIQQQINDLKRQIESK